MPPANPLLRVAGFLLLACAPLVAADDVPQDLKIHRDLLRTYPRKSTPAVAAREVYAAELRGVQERFEETKRALARDPRDRVSLVLLCNHTRKLNEARRGLRAEEAGERARLAKKPQAEVMLPRFDRAAAVRDRAHDSLTGLLDHLKASLATPDEAGALRMLDMHFQEHPVTVRLANQARSFSPVDSLPIRRERIDISGLLAAGEPLRLEEEGGAAGGPARLETGEPLGRDLDPTPDIVFTPEIEELAEFLEHDPLAIYQHVLREYDYDPYVGSRRGADETRRLGAGNDTDLASLLIALLRASGHHARYATGIVELTPEQAMNWLGVDDPDTAGSILTTAGLEGVTITDGTEVRAIRCRRVWVEAHIPYGDYRGAGNAAGGEAWIPLDPAMKTYENGFGVDLMTLSGFDPDAFITDYTATVRAENVIGAFGEELAAYAAASLPDLDFEANRLTRELAEPETPWLPASLPYRVISQDDTWSELPADQRFAIRVHVHGQGAELDHTLSLPVIAGKQVTLSYTGATQEDRDLIEFYGGVFGVPNPSIIEMKPRLRVDGCVVAEGTGSATLGVLQDSDITFTSPGPGGSTETINNSVIVGNTEGLAFATGRTSIPLSQGPDTECEEGFVPWYLHRLGMQYLDRTLRGGREAAALMQAVVLNDVSNAIVGQRISIIYSGGVPLTFEYNGLGVDADRSIASPFSVRGTDIGYDYLRVAGAEGSLQENRVFEEEIGKEAVSTIKILGLAHDAGIPVHTITSANAGTLLPQLTHPSSTVSRISASVSSGNHVTIPRDPVTYLAWSGTGYIDLDPSDGSAGYIISGRNSGGDTAEEEEEPLPGCTGAQILSVTPEEPGFKYSNCDNRTITIEVRMTSYDEECENTGTTIERVQFTPASLGRGAHPFKFGAAGECGGCTQDEVTIIVTSTGVEVIDSNGRKAEGNRLEVVPQGAGEAITCSAPRATGEPKWSVSGALDTELTGKTVNFPASNWLTEVTLLGDLEPEIYTVVLEDCDAPFIVAAYSNKKAAVQFGAMDVEAFLEAMDALDGVVQEIGSPVSLTPSFGGNVTFENQWKEKDGSAEANHTWTLGGEISAGLTAKAKFGSALAGLPPPLAEAALFISLGGKIGLKGTASYDVLGNFQVEGGSFGSITVGVGGEVSAVGGLISITLVAESGITGTAFFGGTGKPAEVYAQTKVEAGQLDISYKTSAVWGIWEGSNTWRAIDPTTLYDDKVVIFPWN